MNQQMKDDFYFYTSTLWSDDMSINIDVLGARQLKIENSIASLQDDLSEVQKLTGAIISQELYKIEECKECGAMAILSGVRLCPTCTNNWVKK